MTTELVKICLFTTLTTQSYKYKFRGILSFFCCFLLAFKVTALQIERQHAL